MLFSRARRAALSFPFAASVWLGLFAIGAPAEPSYGVLRGGGGPRVVTLDPEGNRTSTTTPKGQTTAFEYDELGKLTKVIQPTVMVQASGGGAPTLQSPTTTYVYDEARNRISQMDANNNVVAMEYDDLNRLKKTIQDPNNLNLVTETTLFDENGNPKVVKDPKGEMITNTYDELNRLSKKEYAFAADDPARPWRYTAFIDYAYDANGNLLTTDEHVASGLSPPDTILTTARVYDALDRLRSETQPLPNGGTGLVEYSYYKNGTRKDVTDPAGTVTRYAYDGQNRLASATTDFGTAQAKTTSYAYELDDLLKTVSYPNGVVATHTYDKADRLLGIVNAKDAVPISSYQYAGIHPTSGLPGSYDANGNRLIQVESNGGLTETTTYTYDELDRLASISYPIDSAYPNGRVVSYGYDAVGNRARETERDRADALLADKQGVFDNANRLTELQDLVTPANTTAFTWDANGNQLTKTTAGVTTENRYDLRDKLVEVVQGAATLGRFQYDSEGRRSLKIGEEGLRQYVYDQTSLLTEYDASGLQKAKYDYGSDRLLSLTRADEGRRYFSLDGLRSVVNLTNDSGSAVASYHLDAWGNFRFPDELTHSANRFAFTGHIYDQETGLYNAKARYFDPKLGRFLTQDLAPGQIDRPPSLHRYLYASDNPTTRIDLTGFSDADANALAKALGATGIYGLNRAANQAAAPVNQRLEGVSNLVAPVSYVRDSKGEGAPFLRRVQYRLIDKASDSRSSGAIRTLAGLGAAGMQLPAAANDIVQGVAGVPGRLAAAGSHLKQTFQAESWQGAATELTQAVEETAGAAETTIGAILLARGGAKVIEESRSASRTKVAQVQRPATYDYTNQGGEFVGDDLRMTDQPFGGPSKDAAGRWRNPDGTFAPAPASPPAAAPATTPAATHGNARLSTKPAFLYRLWEADPETGEATDFLKWGVTDNPSERYSGPFMRDKVMTIEGAGPRDTLLNTERSMAEVNPGPLNKEPWAGKRLENLEDKEP